MFTSEHESPCGPTVTDLVETEIMDITLSRCTATVAIAREVFVSDGSDALPACEPGIIPLVSQSHMNLLLPIGPEKSQGSASRHTETLSATYSTMSGQDMDCSQVLGPFEFFSVSPLYSCLRWVSACLPVPGSVCQLPLAFHQRNADLRHQ